MVNKLDDMASYIEDVIPMHQNKWPESANDWYWQIQTIKTFAENRPQYMREHLESFFNLSNLVQSSFYATTGGKIQINSIIPISYPWVGSYYENVPINVKAIPDSGFVFTGWPQYPDSSSSMMIPVYNDFNLTAFFSPYLIGENSNLVINEINYNSSDQFNTGDWVEIYNNGTHSIDISNWYFKDENPNHKFIFPENSNLAAGDYLVLVQDVDAFTTLFPETQNIFGPFDFGLSGSGEEITLYDFTDQLIDKVQYDDTLPWPSEPDGNGPTLELIHPDSLNEFASAWGFSSGNGTPGYLNSVADELFIVGDNIPSKHLLFSVFPNPFNSRVKISFNLNNSTDDYRISIVNILGEVVRTFKRQRYVNGLNTIVWNGKNDFGHDLSTGIYFFRLKSKNIDKSIKLLYVK
jgi:hypothetical protein